MVQNYKGWQTVLNLIMGTKLQGMANGAEWVQGMANSAEWVHGMANNAKWVQGMASSGE